MSLDDARAALGRGDCLVAHDLAMRAAAADPSELRAPYLAVLALARSGATQRAREQFRAFGLDNASSAGLADDLAEDIGALQARLDKDAALAASGTEKQRLAAVAAMHYEATYKAIGRPFACVNAATMWRLAGDADRSRDLARDTLRLLARAVTAPDYWASATEAEARLLLGDEDGVLETLRRAVETGPDVADLASTRRQLDLVCGITGTDPALLEVLRIPRVVHYTGHMVARPGDTGRMRPGDEARVSDEVASLLHSRDVGFGYGALACGADLIIAEALLERGAELHVVLPFEPADFLRASVLPGGDGWRRRFDSCLAAAASVTVVTERGGFDMPALFVHGAEVAMGKALLRASYLGADAEQIAVWNGRPAAGAAGTAVDVATWRRGSRLTHVVAVEPNAGSAPHADSDASARSPRAVRALLFADVRGFSRLSEEQIPAFVDFVLAPLAAALDRFDASIRFRNTWGDGLYVVFDDVATAAAAALALQDTMEHIDLGAAGLPADLALRVGGHAGPVFERVDPITGRPCFYGVEVTRTARIEPGTPVGDVYVTDAFAALVALGGPSGLNCQYVGPVPTAKGFGTLPLYALRRTRTDDRSTLDQ